MKSFLDNKSLPRGLRNNNPGNLQRTGIKWQGKIKGTDSRFESFSSLFYGLRAMATDIANDMTLNGLNTITKLTEAYAPRFENDTTAYIARVSSETGIGKDKEIVLTVPILAQIMRAKIDVENGAAGKLVTNADIMEGIQGMNSATAKRIGLQIKKK